LVYGIYKKPLDASWQALIDNAINSLPVNVIKVVNDNGITLLKDSDAQILAPGETGVSIFDGNEWFIIYDDAVDSIRRKRFTIAHELGHIFLGHPMIIERHVGAFVGVDYGVENEANAFASHFLAPACVLWGLGFHSPANISEICRISSSSAAICSERIVELYMRDEFLPNPLEQQVFKQFKEFIELNRYQTGKK
jgi:Zn-dependent peptidase ImmA (M78 family)